MKIQIYFLLYLSLLIIINIWRNIFPNFQFQQINCIVGQVSFTDGKKKVVDCSSCITYPTQTFQKGQIQIRHGTTQQLKHKSQKKQYQIHAVLYMQTDCIQYLCRDLINPVSFQNQKFISEAGLIPYETIENKIDNLAWQINFKYDNHLQNLQGTNSIKNRFFHYVFDNLVPYSILPSLQYSNGMAIKLRYDLPLETEIVKIEKPIVKITQQSQNSSDLMLISIIISIFAAIKLKIFNNKDNFDPQILYLCFSFINPYLFSLITLVLFSIKNIYHAVSLFLYVCFLCVGWLDGIIICIIISSIFLLKDVNKPLKLSTLLSFNILIIIAMFLNISNMLSAAPTILYAFTIQFQDNNYDKINNESGKYKISQYMSQNQMIQVQQLQI